MTKLKGQALLTFIAKALDLQLDGLYDERLGLTIVDKNHVGTFVRWWNPLTDDGDAFRLSNKFRICIEYTSCEDDSPVVYCGIDVERSQWPMVSNAPDFLATTRRAIVDAAIDYITKIQEATNYSGKL